MDSNKNHNEESREQQSEKETLGFRVCPGNPFTLNPKTRVFQGFSGFQVPGFFLE